MTSNLPTLPANWELQAIGNICEIFDSKRKPITSKDRISGEYPYYGASGILDYIDDYIFDEKLVLIGEDGAKWEANQNTSFIATGLYWVNNHAHVLKPKRSIILDEYLVFYLNFSDLSDYITGATVKKLNQAKLKEIQIPLPPLDEQKRLVSLLDTLFAKIDRSIELLSENITAADALLPSALNTVFGELGEKWETKTVNDIAFVKGGKRLPKGEQLLEKETPYPYLRVTDFTDDGTISTKKMLYLPPEVHDKIKRYTISHEDLYITNVGNTIGKSGIIPKELEGANLTENAVKLVYKDKKNISNKFVFYFTKSATFIFQLESATKQMAIPKLAIMRLGEINIPLPPLDIQTQTVEYLDSIRHKVEILKQVQNDKIKNLKALKASLLDRAFKGEL